MKKLMLLSLVVAVALLGTQAFASPPIKPPVEGFVIHSYTEVTVDPLDGKSSFTESESFRWEYYEGWGKGPLFPNGYVPVQAGHGSQVPFCSGNNCGAIGQTGQVNPNGLVSELGFTQGAEIAYQQTFEAKDGHTEFVKTFDAKSHITGSEDNLVVSKKIEFEADDPTKGYAKHTEKVGLSVISMGAADSTNIGNPAAGMLTLCPWAASSTPSTVTGGGYPPTNEAIAAGSSFNVTRLVGFETKSIVNSTGNPKLMYDVIAPDGDGTISAAFIVDLWEGPKGYVWAPVPLWKNTGTAAEPVWENTTCNEGYQQCRCDQAAIIQNGLNPYAVWQLPQYAYGEPPLASRTSYQENASATGTWSFTKQVSYESVMPSVGAVAAGSFPFNRVP